LIITVSERIVPGQGEQNVLKEKLLALCPEIFQDGKLNVEALQTLLPDELEDEAQQREHFGLNWPGKMQARQLALRKPVGSTLNPCPAEGVNEETTQNVFIEGDNLEVLKLLREAYSDQVKMIYIDPPYNTGKDFIYKDNFTESLDDYLKRTGQRGEGGELLVANPKSSGRFHTNWLNFIYPRLRIARELLQEDGVLFASIDDNEIYNLRQLLNEVFGEENFFAQIIVRANSRGQTYKQIAKTHEYLLAYTKSSLTELFELEKSSEGNDLDLEDNISRFNYRELRNRNPKFGKHNRPNLYYEFYVNPSIADKDGFYSISLVADDNFTIKVLPLNSEGKESCWRWGKPKVILNNNISTLDSNVVARKKGDGKFMIIEKYRKTTFKPKTIWDDNSFLTETGTVETGKLGFGQAFDYPKPVNLIKQAIQISTEESDIVMDFFAGSATTAHAVLDLNASDGGQRRFICVQLDENCKVDSDAYQVGFKNISELSRERIRRVIQSLKDEKPSLIVRVASAEDELQEVKKQLSNEVVLSTTKVREKLIAKLKERVNNLSAVISQIKARLQNIETMDLGFASYVLSSSNINTKKSYTGSDVGQLTLGFQQATDKPLAEGWTKAGLTTEIMLLEGFPLHSEQKKQAQYTENEIVAITSDFNANTLYVCLDAQIHDDTVEELALGPDDVLVCLDAALTDLQKVRMDDKLKLKTV
jgi:adenine-specific DNA-methyltransferase